MTRRLPRFSLVISALLALAAGAIVLLGSGGGHPRSGSPLRLEPAPGSRPHHACAGARAHASITARSNIAAAASAIVPVRVSETVSGPRGTVTVTRSESLTATIRASQPVAFSSYAIVWARACATGESPRAAHALALERAYTIAARQSRRAAAAEAGRGLGRRIAPVYRSLLARARSRAAASARALAPAAQARLAHAARAEARERSGA